NPVLPASDAPASLAAARPYASLALTPREQAASILILLLGATIQALAYATFMVPYNIAAGGMGGLSLIISHLTSLPVGATYFVLNIPMFLLGWFNLGGWNFLGKTLLGVAVFS